MRSILMLLLCVITAQVCAQEAMDLQQLIQLAQKKSVARKQANTRKATQYWQWRQYQSNYKPQMILNGTLPGFTRNSIEVIQPDGNIAFKSVSQHNALVDLSLSQPLALTGGTFFLSSSLQRFDDLDNDFTFYNGIPFQLGFIQPILRFNALKWDRKIEPLRYKESQQDFISDLEAIAGTAVELFFQTMLAQIDRQIAQTNVANTDTIFQITLEKYELGKISRNDLLQLRLEKLKAAKSLTLAEQDLEVASRQLSSYLGDQTNQQWQLVLPESIPELRIAENKALHYAYQHRSDAIAFQRRSIEADRGIARAEGSTGFNASLSGTFGWSNNAATLGGIYQSPQDQQGVFLEFSIPIVDWGRTKAQIETAKANRQLILYEVEQDRLDFEQRILTELRLVKHYHTQYQLSAEADEVAQLRYQIAQDRFLLGDLSITDLSIALQEKDQAKRDYIRALWDYWRSYYRIRLLTLYDFEQNQKINY